MNKKLAKAKIFASFFYYPAEKYQNRKEKNDANDKSDNKSDSRRKVEEYDY